MAVVSKILEVICASTGMGFATVARVTDTEWIACAVLDHIHFGLPAGGTLQLETTLCNEIRTHHHPVVIDEVATDPVYSDHHTPKMYGFQSYISIPIFRKNREFFGTLCAIDPRPAQLNNPKVIGMFQLYADLISFHLEGMQEKENMEQKLMEEKEVALLRDQFIAILGHDLRNPVGAVLNGAELLKSFKLDPTSHQIAQIIQNSSYRMIGLIENMLDFAQGKLGGGIQLIPAAESTLEETLLQIIKELTLVNPNREIKVNIALNKEIYCDGKRIAQLFSNLLGNALSYGSVEAPVVVDIYNTESEFILSVANAGHRIPEAIIPYLFQPFSRGEKSAKKGLGLGLYIANEIAKAHHGKIDITSTEEETRFTLRMPVEG